ncbi:MAG TPA: DUF393 domain-containing protein [Phycisphaerae bacterium]|jgi:predicted DCC family thiol-disulfide oxidoreductase YuxK|nr:DUF393 domain-containing protein [Phycisphaerae bacterium]
MIHPYHLFYDGTCGLCRRSVRAVLSRHPRVPVIPVDAADPAALAKFPQIPPRQAMKSVHLLYPDGRVRKGYDAVVALTRLLPGYRWLVPVMRIGVVRRVGWAAYEWVTRHRHQISRALGWSKSPKSC